MKVKFFEDFSNRYVAPIAGVRANSGNYKSGAISEETVVRFSNSGHHPKNSKLILTSNKQSCVGDYSCCGRIP